MEILDEALRSKPMTASGVEGDSHVEKFVKPFIGRTDTHTTHREFRDPESRHVISSGSKITIHGHEVVNGKHHAIVSKSGSSQKVRMPISNILKPTNTANAGIEHEDTFAKHLNRHGLMTGRGGGSSERHDFHLENKNSGTKIHGETKSSLSAAFGQATLSHTSERGWHFSDATKARFPHYTHAVENSTVTRGGVRKSLIGHINDTFGAPNKIKKSSENVYSDHSNLHPAHAYLRDHDVDVLHVGTHGTFRAGHSAVKDRTSLGLPVASGGGRFRVRQKDRNGLTVQFNVSHLEKSPVDMSKSEHLSAIKRKLGH